MTRGSLLKRGRRLGAAGAAIATMVTLFTAVSQPASADTPPARGTAERAVFDAINASRVSAHLPALRWHAGLQASAAFHNRRMASRDMLSHQIPGEISLGTRVTLQHVAWTYAAENIGWSSDMTTHGVLSLENAMIHEAAPNDGHRRNLLSRSLNYVGVSVQVDPAHHRIWLTEDFARV